MPGSMAGSGCFAGLGTGPAYRGRRHRAAGITHFLMVPTFGEGTLGRERQPPVNLPLPAASNAAFTKNGQEPVLWRDPGQFRRLNHYRKAVDIPFLSNSVYRLLKFLSFYVLLSVAYEIKASSFNGGKIS